MKKNRRYWLIPKTKIKENHYINRHNIYQFEDLLEVIELTLDSAVHQTGKYYISSRPEIYGDELKFLVQSRTIGSKPDDYQLLLFSFHIASNKKDSSIHINSDKSQRSIIITKKINGSYLERIMPTHKKIYFPEGEKIKMEKKFKKEKNEIEICGRCDGGNIKNCQTCNGKGFIKTSETKESKIKIKVGAYNLDGYATPSPYTSNNKISDHESIHRSDPNDANKIESTSIREGGQFGSTPLHDEFD